MLTELLRAGDAELARRWLAALLMIPEDERALVVDAVEDRIVREYGLTLGTGDEDERVIHVHDPPHQREGYVEEVIRTYGVSKPGAAGRGRSRRRRRSG